ncbi:EGLN3 [Symbiodinium natans]|uniref:EGLN3 protein n=1 Tax=Symbiodinium natans TaxID=878477 RepID=A0A812HQP6_9DINO|nr:EGLN3 [Symbiodinium natans]
MDEDDEEPEGRKQLAKREEPRTWPISLREDFTRSGVCVISNFLGDGTAAALRKASLGLFADGGMAPGALGGGGDGRGIQRSFRGDYVAWLGPHGVNEPTKRCRREGAVKATLRAGSKLLEDDHQFTVPSASKWVSLLGTLTARLDMVVDILCPNLDRGEVMASVYPPDCGAQFRRHLDNPCHDGRRISAVYYVNAGWQRKDGALLRCWPRQGEVEEILPDEDTLAARWEVFVGRQPRVKLLCRRLRRIFWSGIPQVACVESEMPMRFPSRFQVLFEADAIEHEVTQNRSTGIFPDGYRCAFTCWYWEGSAPHVDLPRRRRSRSNRRRRQQNGKVVRPISLQQHFWLYLCRT